MIFCCNKLYLFNTVTVWLGFGLEHGTGPSSDFVVKILGVDLHCFFDIHNFITF
jgi:hypothetical protein